jgi:hypothetical protein
MSIALFCCVRIGVWINLLGVDPLVSDIASEEVAARPKPNPRSISEEKPPPSRISRHIQAGHPDSL